MEIDSPAHSAEPWRDEVAQWANDEFPVPEQAEAAFLAAVTVVEAGGTRTTAMVAGRRAAAAFAGEGASPSELPDTAALLHAGETSQIGPAWLTSGGLSDPTWSGHRASGLDFTIGLPKGWDADRSSLIGKPRGYPLEFIIKAKKLIDNFHSSLLLKRRWIGERKPGLDHEIDALQTGQGYAGGLWPVGIGGVEGLMFDDFPNTGQSGKPYRSRYALAYRNDVLLQFCFVAAERVFETEVPLFERLLQSVDWRPETVVPARYSVQGADYQFEAPEGVYEDSATETFEVRLRGYWSEGTTSSLLVRRGDAGVATWDARVAQLASAEGMTSSSNGMTPLAVAGVVGVQFQLSKPERVMPVAMFVRGPVSYSICAFGPSGEASRLEGYVESVVGSLVWTRAPIPMSTASTTAPSQPAAATVTPSSTRTPTPRNRTPQVQVKTYKDEREFEHDAQRMLAAGWTLQGQSSRERKTAIGRTAGKVALTGGLGLLMTGRSKKGDRISATWVR